MAVADFFTAGGETALIVRLEGEATTQAAFSAGLAALDAVDFNILVLTPDQIEGDVPTFAREAAAVCVAQRQAMLILDAPAAWTSAQQAVDNLADLGQFPQEALGRIVCYFPRAAVQMEHPQGGTILSARPVSGAAAGLWALTDRAQGVWIPAAGPGAVLPYQEQTNLLTVDDLALLSMKGLNVVRLVAGAGLCLWGARTRLPDMLSNFITQRRLLDHIQASVARGLAWTAVEPPTPMLMGQVATEVSAFLAGIWQAGGLFGPKVSDAFSVICDRSNNPLQDFGGGRLVIDMRLAITAPAEFVVLQMSVPVAAA
ncbi:MAG: hypothetical protein QM608_13515 [Caulobacter sp.]